MDLFAKNILFWNVDTQIDFMSAQGKLYAPGAERIQPILRKITGLAKANNIQVVNTADYHYSNSKELSDSPNFINTFPPHCMANTPGAEYVEETKPDEPYSEVFGTRCILKMKSGPLSQEEILSFEKMLSMYSKGTPTPKPSSQ